MKKLVLVFMGILFITACSSTGDRNTDTAPGFDGDLGFTNPGVNPENPIEEDTGYKVIDDQIFHNGELIGTIEGGLEGDGTKNVVAPNGQTIATVQNEHSGIWTLHMIDPENPYAGGGDIYKIDTRNGEIKIDWANSKIDDRYGNPTVPPMPEPTLTIAKPTTISNNIAANIKSRIKVKR